MYIQYLLELVADRISARQPNPGCIFAIVYVLYICTCPSRLGMSNATSIYYA